MTLSSLSLELQVSVGTVLGLLVILDFVGNGLVILAIRKYRDVQAPMDFLLINLAIADIITALGMAPWFVFFSETAHPRGTGGVVLCLALTKGTIMWIGAVCSAILLTAIAFERYYSIVRPFQRAAKMSRKNIQRIVYFSWGFSILLNLPLYFGIYFDVKSNSCRHHWPYGVEKPYAIAWALFVGVIPFGCFAVLYFKVIKRLWFSGTDPEANRTQIALLRHRKRATKMIITVTAIFILCTGPNRVYYVITSFGLHGAVHGDVVVILTRLLTIVNATINPIVYAIQNQRIRKQMQSLFCTNQVGREVQGSGKTNTATASAENCTQQQFVNIQDPSPAQHPFNGIPTCGPRALGRERVATTH